MSRRCGCTISCTAAFQVPEHNLTPPISPSSEASNVARNYATWRACFAIRTQHKTCNSLTAFRISGTLTVHF